MGSSVEEKRTTPKCALCGEKLMGIPVDVTVSIGRVAMCADGLGCRRRAYELFVRSDIRKEG